MKHFYKYDKNSYQFICLEIYIKVTNNLENEAPSLKILMYCVKQQRPPQGLK